MNIFNLEDVSDLPESVRGRVGKCASFQPVKPRMSNMVTELFLSKGGERILTIDELIVGLFRKFQVVRGRDDVLNGISIIDFDPSSEIRFIEVGFDVFKMEMG